jgi:hypothetical protein
MYSANMRPTDLWVLVQTANEECFAWCLQLDLMEYSRSEHLLSEWIPFVQAARRSSEQNVEISLDHCNGRRSLFYRVIRRVTPNSELFAWYSDQLAEELGLPVIGDDWKKGDYIWERAFSKHVAKVAYSPLHTSGVTWLRNVGGYFPTNSSDGNSLRVSGHQPRPHTIICSDRTHVCFGSWIVLSLFIKLEFIDCVIVKLSNVYVSHHSPELLTRHLSNELECEQWIRYVASLSKVYLMVTTHSLITLAKTKAFWLLLGFSAQLVDKTSKYPVASRCLDALSKYMTVKSTVVFVMRNGVKFVFRRRIIQLSELWRTILLLELSARPLAFQMSRARKRADGSREIPAQFLAAQSLDVAHAHRGHWQVLFAGGSALVGFWRRHEYDAADFRRPWQRETRDDEETNWSKLRQRWHGYTVEAIGFLSVRGRCAAERRSNKECDKRQLYGGSRHRQRAEKRVPSHGSRENCVSFRFAIVVGLASYSAVPVARYVVILASRLYFRDCSCREHRCSVAEFISHELVVIHRPRRQSRIVLIVGGGFSWSCRRLSGPTKRKPLSVSG